MDYWESWVKYGFNQMEKHVWPKDSLLASLRGIECFKAAGIAISSS
jgi:hypothetical protein